MVFKTPAEFVLEKGHYDFLIVRMVPFNMIAGLSYLKEKMSLDRVFLILEESKADLVDSYLLSGIKDVFVMPINFTELGHKAKEGRKF